MLMQLHTNNIEFLILSWLTCCLLVLSQRLKFNCDPSITGVSVPSENGPLHFPPPAVLIYHIFIWSTIPAWCYDSWLLIGPGIKRIEPVDWEVEGHLWGCFTSGETIVWDAELLKLGGNLAQHIEPVMEWFIFNLLSTILSHFLILSSHMTLQLHSIVLQHISVIQLMACACLS